MLRNLLLILGTTTCCLMAQEKRLKASKVSAQIKCYIHEHYLNASKLRFYEEKENDSTFVECTLKYEKHNFSLVFFKDSIYEKEELIDYQELDQKTRTEIDQQLDSLFIRYKIKTCELLHFNKMIEVNVRARKHNYVSNYEIYFDTKGRLQKQVEIVSKPLQTLF